MNPEEIKNKALDHMVDRFLGWKLPEDFGPDGGISFDPIFNKGTAYEMRHNPMGTNLLNAIQAKAMFAHVAEPLFNAIAELRLELEEVEHSLATSIPLNDHVKICAHLGNDKREAVAEAIKEERERISSDLEAGCLWIGTPAGDCWLVDEVRNIIGIEEEDEDD